MEYSERHLSLTARSGASSEAQLASRLLENVGLYRSWEHTHGRLMQTVAAAPRQSAPLELRKVAFLTLHRKAPFEYLRDRHVIGLARRQIIQALFGEAGILRALAGARTRGLREFGLQPAVHRLAVPGGARR